MSVIVQHSASEVEVGQANGERICVNRGLLLEPRGADFVQRRKSEPVEVCDSPGIWCLGVVREVVEAPVPLFVVLVDKSKPVSVGLGQIRNPSDYRNIIEVDVDASETTICDLPTLTFEKIPDEPQPQVPFKKRARDSPDKSREPVEDVQSEESKKSKTNDSFIELNKIVTVDMNNLAKYRRFHESHKEGKLISVNESFCTVEFPDVKVPKSLTVCRARFSPVTKVDPDRVWKNGDLVQVFELSAGVELWWNAVVQHKVDDDNWMVRWIATYEGHEQTSSVSKRIMRPGCESMF